MKDLIFTTVLALAAAEDVNSRHIDRFLPVILAGTGIADCFLTGRDPAGAVISLLPGLFTFVLALLSGEKLGEGDAAAFTALGFGFDAETVTGIMCLSFLSAGLFSFFIIMKGEERADDSFAFMPFILCSFAADRILQAL